jgi:hypothetical protein
MHCNMQDKSFCCSFSGLQLEFDQLSGEDGHARGLHHFFHEGAHCGGVPIRGMGAMITAKRAQGHRNGIAAYYGAHEKPIG